MPLSRKTKAKAAKGRGRPGGSRNRITNEAKQAILTAFDRLGGVDRLVEWVKEDIANEALFWTRIFPKLLPRPAAEAAAQPEALPAVTGALLWDKPTPSPYPRLSASTAAAAVAALAAEGAAPQPPGRQAAGPPEREESD